jgi:hypothetical protein
MKTHFLSIATILLASVLMTSCQKDGLTKLIDAEHSSQFDANKPGTMPGSDTIISTLNAQLEASLTVKSYDCVPSRRQHDAKDHGGKPEECLNQYVAKGFAYGLSEEFGYVKSDVTIKYEPTTDVITGNITLQMEHSQESLTLLFNGLLSESETGNISKFRALSSDSFHQKYFTGFVSIQDLEKLLKSKGLKNLPMSVYGVFD